LPASWHIITVLVRSLIFAVFVFWRIFDETLADSNDLVAQVALLTVVIIVIFELATYLSVKAQARIFL